jgi:hypothetical protein
MSVIPLRGASIPGMEFYRVRRLTAFAWRSDQTDPEEFVARAASLFEWSLRERYPSMDGRVSMVRVDGMPQLVFEGTVYAQTEREARTRGIYRFEKALQTKVSVGGRARRLSPPWGVVTVEQV